MPRRIALLTVTVLLSAVPALAQTWQIDPAHSRAQFTARHFGISNVRGDFGGVSGTVEFDGKDVTKARINATIDVNTLTTRVQKRDEHLKSPDFLDAAKYPTMTFVSTSITPAGQGKYKMKGNLTLRGVTKEVTFDLEQPAGPITHQGQTRVGAAASTTINRKDFGVNYHAVLDNGGIGVSDDIFIQLDVELLRKAAAPGQTN